MKVILLFPSYKETKWILKVKQVYAFPAWLVKHQAHVRRLLQDLSQGNAINQQLGFTYELKQGWLDTWQLNQWVGTQMGGYSHSTCTEPVENKSL